MEKDKEKIKKKIVQFAKRYYRNFGIVPSGRKIEKKFNIHFWFYFPDGMSKLYRLCGFKFSPEHNRQKSIEKRWEKIQKLKRKEIIDFLKKEYKNSGTVPSGRLIYKKFKTDIWSYFRGGLREAYRICGFKFSPEENKRKSREKTFLQRRNKKRREIIRYFIRMVKEGKRSTGGELEKKFSISLLTYFPEGMRGFYKATRINPPVFLRDREKLQKEIIKYIQVKVKNGFYPTGDEIEEKFQTNVRNSLSIRKLYELAEVEYKRDPNPFLKYKKERKLADMALKLFPKLGYKIKRISIGPSRPSGADIIVEDNQKRLIPVEIKAYQKFGKIGHAKDSPYYFRSEILQVKRYIKALHAPYGYLITSTNQKIFKRMPSNIKILFGKDLRKLLNQFKMKKEIKNLNWIRDSSVSYGKEEAYRKIRNKILKYTANSLEQGRYVSRREIFKKFRVNPDSYFPGGTGGMYKQLNIDPELIPNYRMSRNFDKKKFRQRIINFVKEENKKGRFPTYKEIQREFSCLPKLFFPGGIREIAKLIGIKYNRKFATKTPEEKEAIRQKVIGYAVKKLRIGFYPGYRDIESKFHINFQYYFKNPEELYQRAGFSGIAKKTWKNSGKKVL